MKFNMFKTIRSKMIIMQGALIFLILGIMFVVFSVFAEDYYFSRKLKAIESSFQVLSKQDMSKISNASKSILAFEEQKLRFIICDEDFTPVYVTTKRNNVISVKTKIKSKIINKKEKYPVNQIKTKNLNNKILGRGIITQKEHSYYVYVEELKPNTKIHFSYYNLFFAVIVVLTALVGMIVSIIISNRICRPIKQFEEKTREAADNNYSIDISEKQKFKELSELARSFNKMMAKIREQINSLEREIQRKTNSENLRRQFVNNVSHEMKTPLAIISNQVEMLELLHDEEKKREYCQSIIEETDNMAEMINDMIMVYSIQSDEENMTVSCSDINELVEFTCRDYDKLIEAKKFSIHEQYPEECTAWVNEKFFTQAVSNYLTNAIKHCSEEGNIFVRVFSLDDFIRVEVENEGSHIDGQRKNNIWDMFYQGNDAYTLNGQKGSGLGLYLVKSIVELHHGRYGFENTDRGVMFYIELPKTYSEI